ncbi:Thioredoxin [Perkinsela sp. CCAP 1560/4]|nr:Thioredoxin [Perkinsela sp. CCAP 1560/4]KNH07930.1 Thioredoxin [Perkinsela sp. CCAP 1560/4]|eukprot:KNH05424.1 Thioredoxin [Perkinsela sp. CCAP 1560/4]
MSSFYKRFIEPLKTIKALKQPPLDGYTVYTFSHNQEIQEYLTVNAQKLSIVVVASLHSEIFKRFQKEIVLTPLGHPNDVSLGYIDIKKCSDAFLDAHRVMTMPTCLLFHDRKLVYKVCGLRLKELSLKSRLSLRSTNLNPCSS